MSLQFPACRQKQGRPLKRETPIFSELTLRGFIARLFMARGMSASSAEAVARVLVWADLRGGDTHGVSRTAHYFGMIDKGAMKPLAEPRLRVDFGALAAFDAEGAAGPVAMLKALGEAQTRARAHGIGDDAGWRRRPMRARWAAMPRRRRATASRRS